jgi:Ni,Fe-hydrogenase III large subunit
MRLIARFAKELDRDFEIITIYDKDITKELISKEHPHLKSIAHEYPSATWFERKMSDDFGIKIDNSFDNRKLVQQERFPANVHPMLKIFDKHQTIELASYTPYPYERIKGDSVFEVAVGPIHAGIIEPGHFHFSQAGEDILHLEVRHFYKYRGIEKMLEGLTLQEAKPIIERISGNETIAYQIALRDIILESNQIQIPKSMQKQHALLLELERVIHHLTDVGFIPNDVGFAPALAFASTMAEDTRRVMKSITSHRFGFGAINLKSSSLEIELIHNFLNKLEIDIRWFKNWVYDIPSLWDRLDTTGLLSSDEAIKFDSVGVVARASNLDIDRRNNSFYKTHGFKLIKDKTGDVASRFKVRIEEIFNSIELMRNFIDNQEFNIEIKDAQDGEYISYCESSLGELFMYISIKDGKIERFFSRDPSFMNWQVVHAMMPNNIIADFPLINKSCDLSYAGNDL